MKIQPEIFIIVSLSLVIISVFAFAPDFDSLVAQSNSESNLSINGSGIANYAVIWSNASSIRTSKNIYDNGTFVGIGTNTSSGDIVELKGNITFQNNNYLKMKDNVGAKFNLLYVSTSNNVCLGAPTGGDVYITASNVFALKSTGSVGINAVTPGAKLHVNATSGASIRTSSNSLTSGVTMYSSHSSSDNRNWFSGSNWLAYGDYAIIQSSARNGDPISAGVPRLYINKNGYVGLNTSSPTYPLVVASNVTGISIWAQANVSAAGYITRTSVWDVAQHGSALSWVRNSSELKNGNHIRHELYAPTRITYNISVPNSTRISFYLDENNENKERIERTYKTIEEEGVLLDEIIAKHEQAIYELNQKIQLLEQKHGGG